MPYRAELKRPDLKGQFPCSVCGKIFCHSSSLSRHRMQAHFKSYTCTQCNLEISSNETLRSHMFRMHSISRMFMCRCCNWAFPDKTSLHIHMQSMLRNGTPGDVAVLARSSTDDGPGDSGSLSPSYYMENNKQTPLSTTGVSSNNNNLQTENHNFQSIFPNVVKPENILHLFQKQEVSKPSVLPNNQWLSSWMANNPFAASIDFLTKNMESQQNKNMQSEMDGMEIETTEEDLKDEEEHTYSDSPRLEDSDTSFISSSSPTHAVTDVEEQTETKIDKSQLSPSASDSTTISAGCQHSYMPPQKCFDCQVFKGRLAISNAKVREYEKKIAEMEEKLNKIQKHAMSLPQTQPPQFQNIPNLFNPSLQMMQNPAMKLLFQNFIQSSMARQSC